MQKNGRLRACFPRLQPQMLQLERVGYMHALCEQRSESEVPFIIMSYICIRWLKAESDMFFCHFHIVI